MKPFYPARFSTLTLVLACLLIALAAPVKANTASTVAVLPFSIHADQNINYVKKGISQMFYSRLSWPEKVMVISPRKVRALNRENEALPAKEQILSIADETSSQYVLTGSVTQFDGAFSIDAKVFDVPRERYMAFSEWSENADDLIQKVDRIAAAVNQRIFDRSTLTWQEMEKEKLKQINELKRKNPEHLMQLPRPIQPPEEEIGWKLWKYLF